MNGQPEQNKDNSRKWIYFGVAAAAAFMSTLDSSIVNVALPTLKNQFDADVKTIAWVVQAYILTATALLLIGGRLLDLIGERKLFALGFSLFTVGSTLCAFSVSIYMLIFSRVFQALGGAVLMSSNQGLIAKSFPPKQRGRILGTIGTVVSVGLATGPPLGGFLIGAFGWRSIFYINLPIGVAAVIFALHSLANNPRVEKNHRFDWLGSILIVTGLSTLFLGMNFGTDFGWMNARVWILILFSALILFLFFLNENKASHPLLKLTLFKQRYFSQSCLCAFLAFVGLMTSSILMPFYLQDVLGFPPAKVGLFMMTVPASMFLVAPFSGWLSDIIGTRIPATIGLGLLATGLFMLSTLHIDSGTIDVVWRLVVLGIGMGVFSSPNSNAILSSVPRRFVGAASGLTALMRTSGIAFGLAVAVTTFTFFKDSSGIPTAQAALQYLSGLGPAFKIAAGIMVVNMIVSATRGKRPDPE